MTTFPTPQTWRAMPTTKSRVKLVSVWLRRKKIDCARPDCLGKAGFCADASLRVTSKTWFDICLYSTQRYHTNESDLKRPVSQEAGNGCFV